jgi:hypothetical protein
MHGTPLFYRIFNLLRQDSKSQVLTNTRKLSKFNSLAFSLRDTKYSDLNIIKCPQSLIYYLFLLKRKRCVVYSCSQTFELCYSFKEHIFVIVPGCFQKQHASQGNIRNANNSRTLVDCWNSSVVIGTSKWPDNRVRFYAGQGIFLCLNASRQSLEFKQSHIKSIPGLFPRG